ncbi:unnamed protein product [Ilex paraguariensis]|uniref:Uncharacterized protein n=1 Tax=Ilex paraguariensis TaxID=185542 RepID=A0ABC8TY34_9AQUA
MTGFEECVTPEELYLSHNGIANMEGLSTLMNLRVLDVSSNKLTTINDIENLTQKEYQLINLATWIILEDLWLNDNQITSLEGIMEAVAGSNMLGCSFFLSFAHI